MADNVKKTDDIDNYYVLKGRFRGAESNSFGLFIIFFSIAQKNIDSVNVAASHFSSIYDNTPSSNWDVFEEKISQLKWKGEISMNASQDLQLLLSNSLRQDMVEELIDAIKRDQNNKIDHTLVTIFEKGLGDKTVALDFKTQKVSHSDIIKAKDERTRRERDEAEVKEKEAVRKAEDHQFKVEEGAVILPVSLILAPVSGIPIYEVKSRDVIMIKISGTSEKANYFIDLLNARTPEGEVAPLKGTVKEIYTNNLREFELLIEIGPGVYGKTVESEQVKIKRFDVREERIKVSAAQGNIKSETAFQRGAAGSGNKDFFVWVVGGITFLLAILILYLLFSGLL